MLVGAVLLTLGSVAAEVEAQRMPPRGAQGRVLAARGRLGMMFREVEDRVIVTNVLRDSPAEGAGVQVGDTISLWNGRRDVAIAMRERPLQPGDTVRVRVRRGAERDQTLAMVAADVPERVLSARRTEDGDEVIVVRPEAIERRMRGLSDSLMVRADSLHERLQLLMRDSLGPRLRELERNQLPEIEARLRRFADGESIVIDLGRRSVAGAEFTEVNAGLAEYFGTDDGVLVLKVAPETPAARAGLQAGDVVVRADGETVGAISELRRVVARAQSRDDRRVKLEVLRRSQRRELEMSWE
ncbi:MAG: PDZ domain-containing protein [Gemmatimonadetes bacterium]|nr:PDZ domain-containing protein [Gemmatimonadota bacterium]